MAQAAATLAATVVGYEIGLFDDAVVNGAIVMILVTCVIAPSFSDIFSGNAFKNGLLLLGAGPSTIRFCPPLTLDKETADEGLAVMERVMVNPLSCYTIVGAMG